ncbi:hypothetical protein EDC19_0107, partial [Natranaerovirga hydrolytica]
MQGQKKILILLILIFSIRNIGVTFGNDISIENEDNSEEVIIEEDFRRGDTLETATEFVERLLEDTDRTIDINNGIGLPPLVRFDKALEELDDLYYKSTGYKNVYTDLHYEDNGHQFNEAIYSNTGMLVLGNYNTADSNGNPRFMGYVLDYQIGKEIQINNFFRPPELGDGTNKIDNWNLIKNPWDDKDIVGNNNDYLLDIEKYNIDQQSRENLRSTQETLENLLISMEVYLGDTAVALNLRDRSVFDGFTNNPKYTNDERGDLQAYIEDPLRPRWEDAIAIIEPATQYSGGLAMMWHNTRDSNGHPVKAYRSFPILPYGYIKEMTPEPFVPEDTDEDGEETGEDLMNGDFINIIAADIRGQEAFNVEEGIPVTEPIYINLEGNRYLIDYNLVQRTGTREYRVNLSKNYRIIYTIDGEEHISNITRRSRETVTRDYAYWEIDYITVHALDKGEVHNKVLEEGSLVLHPEGYKEPIVDLYHSQDINDHITAEENRTLNYSLGTTTLRNPGSIQEPNWRAEAQRRVPQIKVNNDRLIIDGHTILSDQIKTQTTDPPNHITDIPKIGQDVLYTNNLTIPTHIENGTYPSTGTITYKKIADIRGKQPETININLDINPVVVHTPVINTPTIEVPQHLNQQKNPVQEPVVLLDETFKLYLPNTGEHLNIKGYGTRNYQKYKGEKQIKASFDLYIGEDQTGDYIQANTWHSIDPEKEELTLYTPTWAKEKENQIHIRTKAINTPEGI